MLISKFNTIPITIAVSYFNDTDKLILKFICKGKRPKIPELFKREQDKLGSLTLSNYKIYNKSTVIKKV